MKPIFQQARSVAAEKKRVVFAEGEEERVLRAVQIVVDEKLATPILIASPDVCAAAPLPQAINKAAKQTGHKRRMRSSHSTIGLA